ncbi:MAG TPA: hypothetical protein VE961_23310, partial [Pyrinomonadaceae bacterium]|nr:hypothetical protein [Pyrinomonadaceae bacterium]
VRGVLWEYVASDLDSGAELNRRRFTNLEEIAAGKTATLSGTSSLPPTSIVTSGGLGKNGESPYKSSADIKCVLYDDGTEWAAGGAKDCDELRKAHDDARGRKTKR